MVGMLFLSLVFPCQTPNKRCSQNFRKYLSWKKIGKCISLSGDSKWPFYPLIWGQLYPLLKDESRQIKPPRYLRCWWLNHGQLKHIYIYICQILDHLDRNYGKLQINKTTWIIVLGCAIFLVNQHNDTYNKTIPIGNASSNASVFIAMCVILPEFRFLENCWFNYGTLPWMYPPCFLDF